MADIKRAVPIATNHRRDDRDPAISFLLLVPTYPLSLRRNPRRRAAVHPLCDLSRVNTLRSRKLHVQ
jgi:hypothetical protein